MADKPLPKLEAAKDGQAGVAARASVLVKIEEAQFKSIERLVVLFTNVSDNLYNIAGFMGAQLTSLKQTEEALKAMVPDEGEQTELRAEANKQKQIKEKEKNPFQKLIDFFDNLTNILIPFLIGFFIGLKKEFGLIAGLVLLFRKQIFAILKELPRVIAFMAGFLRTAISNAITSLSKAFKGLAAKFPTISGKVAQIASRVINEFRGVLAAYSSQIEKISKVFSRIAVGFKNVTQSITTAGAKLFNFFRGGFLTKAVDLIVDSFRQVGRLFKLLMRLSTVTRPLLGAGEKAVKGVSALGQFIAKITQFFTAGAKAAGSVGKVLGAFGRFLGPIGVVISTITALFKGFTQAFKGFDEEGVFGAIKGFASGVISGLVGWLGDLGAWLLSKLLGALGFDQLAAKIGEFNFTEFLNKSIQGAFDVVKNFFGDMITAIPNIFSGFINNITNAFSKIFSGDDIIGGIVDLLTAVPQMLIDLVVAPFKALGDAIKEVFNFDIATLGKKLLIAIAPPSSMLGKLIGTGKLEAEVSESDAQMARQKADKEKLMSENQKNNEKEKKAVSLEKKQIDKEEKVQVAKQQITSKEEKALQQPLKDAREPQQQIQPLPQQPARGDALAAESQKVAGAQQTGGGGSQNNIVAPNTTTNVNQNSNQNLSIRPSAVPTFGMAVSYGEANRPAFGF